MKTKICISLPALILLIAGPTQAVDVDFYSDATIENGDVYEFVSVYDTPPDFTTVDMIGGTVDSLRTYDSSVANIYGGSILIDPQSYDSSTINIYAGTIICESIIAWDSSTLNIYGGSLHIGNSPYFSESSSVNVYGYGFSYDGFELTGFLLDDSAFSMRELSQWEYEHINLIPEPGSVILLAAGLLMMTPRRK